MRRTCSNPRLWSSLLVSVILASCGGAPPAATTAGGQVEPEAQAAVIYHGATVHTLDDSQPGPATGLRIANGVITHLFHAEVPAELSGRRVDLHGATVIPGLVDGHLHLRSLGAAMRQIDLTGTRSVSEVAERVQRAAEGAPSGAWIRGRGWDQNDWEPARFPDHRALSAAAPGHPVWLTRVDGHAVWLNQEALTLTGINESTETPEGGEILRAADGQPSGVLIDNAIDLAQARLPEPSAEELRTDLSAALSRCAAAGLTAVHDMGVPPSVLAALRALDGAGELPVRVFVYLGGEFEALRPLLQTPPDREGKLQVVGVKLFADGALGSRGAALLAPYSDRPDTEGLLLTEAQVLAERARQVHAAGYQLAIHAIGDRGNRIALDTIEAAQGSDRDRRHRVEHAQIIDPADIPRFAALGAVASMQPVHATSDMPWVPDRLGPDRLAGAYAWRSLLEDGALLAFGTDAPVESEAPWPGIYAAVTRMDGEGAPAGGWLPNQRLSVEQALVAYTAGPWRALGEDGGGRIRVGDRADLTVVDRDPLAVDAADLQHVRVVRTIVGGHEAFAR